MAKLREETPQEFTNDERWYKYFTTTSLVVVMVFGIFTFFLTTILSYIGLGVVGLVVGIVITAVAFVIVSFKVPSDDYIHGGGTLFADIIFRMLARRRIGRIYIKDFDSWEQKDNYDK